MIGFRRENREDFRTNVRGGGRCLAIQPSDQQAEMARLICGSLKLTFASVDLIDADDGPPKVLEVNAIPGWKGAQSVCDFSIADQIVGLLMRKVSCTEARGS